MPTGEATLVPMPPEGDAQPGGGGGGSGPLLGEARGAGGGSGGVIELTTPGVLATNAVIQADGGQGGPCEEGLTDSGAGGGGAGGAIMVRAGAVASAAGQGPALQVSARHGEGGACNSAGGGDGGDGRIRLDLPASSETIAGLEMASPAPFVAPSFVAAEIPTIVREPMVVVSIRGGAGADDYELLVTSPEGDGETQRTRIDMVPSPGPAGTGKTAVELFEGFNRLCLRVAPGADPDSLPEAANCLNIAYIPR
jgi:hypothetical protein